MNCMHWLPVKYRIQFKILLLTFKAIHGMAPDYISRLLDVRQQTRYSLRSSSSVVLNYPKGRMLSSFGDRSFSVAAPKVWDSLPASLRDIVSLNCF